MMYSLSEKRLKIARFCPQWGGKRMPHITELWSIRQEGHSIWAEWLFALYQLSVWIGERASFVLIWHSVSWLKQTLCHAGSEVKTGNETQGIKRGCHAGEWARLLYGTESECSCTCFCSWCNSGGFQEKWHLACAPANQSEFADGRMNHPTALSVPLPTYCHIPPNTPTRSRPRRTSRSSSLQWLGAWRFWLAP